MISGYLNAKLFAQSFKSLQHAKSWQKVLAFYTDRLIRFAPQYLFFVILIIFLNKWLNRSQAFEDTALNFNLQIFLPLFAILPFTIMAPIFGRILFAISFLLFAFTTFNFHAFEMAMVNWLPVAFLSFFLGRGLGMFEIKKSPTPVFIAIGFYILAMTVLIVALNTRFIQANFNKEILLALAMGFPLLAVLSQSHIKLRYDALLGKMAYGTFLSHAIVSALIDSQEQAPAVQYLILAALCTLVGFICVFVFENQFAKWRYQWRAHYQLRLTRIAANEE